MKLIFIRHGQAAPYCADDAGRDLTEFGQAQAAETAAYLVQKHKLNMIIASPFNRAEQTAKILKQTANNQGQTPVFITLNTITPDDDPVVGIADIERIITSDYGHEHDKTIAIVCHMPIVARMVAYLDADGLPPPMFDLAEYRVLDTKILAQGLANQVERYSPVQP